MGTRHLHDLVDERLRTLPPDAVRALEVLAVAGELPLHLLEDVVGPAALDALDGASLVAFRTDGARAFIRTVHPVHDEVMRARVGVLARRRHFGELAVALQRRGARRREDAVRLALWHLESGHGADVDLLLRAARLSLAFLDPEPAIRLATAARTAGSAAASALIIAEARSIQGRYDDVEAVLALGAHDVSSLPDADRARFAGRRASNLVHGLGDADAAEAVLRRALAASTSEEGSRFLRGKQAGMEAVSGDVERAEAAVDELLRSDDLETRVQAGYAGGFAFLHDARVEATLEVTRAAYRDHVALEGTPGHGHPASQLVSATLALAIGGRLDEADVMVDEFRRGSERTANALGLLLAHMLDGEVATLRGDLERARQGYARAALAAGEQRGWVADKALTGRGLVAAWMGDHDAARTTLDQADATPMAVRWPRFERDRLRGWVAWLEGRPDHAEEVFATAADAAASLHDRWMEAVLRHDIVRLGRATDVDRLTHLAGACDAALVHDLADHARARAERDATGLVDAADDLERHGFAGLAVGALADAAVVSAAAGDQRAARELRRRMAVVATRCPGLHLADLGEGDVVEPLTDREREIALLAAARRSNKEIAEQLYLSVRTVENHLAKVYEKLGVKGRRDLVAALEAER